MWRAGEDYCNQTLKLKNYQLFSATSEQANRYLTSGLPPLPPSRSNGDQWMGVLQTRYSGATVPILTGSRDTDCDTSEHTGRIFQRTQRDLIPLPRKCQRELCSHKFTGTFRRFNSIPHPQFPVACNNTSNSRATGNVRPPLASTIGLFFRPGLRSMSILAKKTFMIFQHAAVENVGKSGFFQPHLAGPSRHPVENFAKPAVRSPRLL